MYREDLETLDEQIAIDFHKLEIGRRSAADHLAISVADAEFAYSDNIQAFLIGLVQTLDLMAQAWP